MVCSLWRSALSPPLTHIHLQLLEKQRCNPVYQDYIPEMISRTENIRIFALEQIKHFSSTQARTGNDLRPWLPPEERLGVELLLHHIKWSQLRWLRYFLVSPLGGVPGKEAQGQFMFSGPLMLSEISRRCRP